MGYCISYSGCLLYIPLHFSQGVLDLPVRSLTGGYLINSALN